MRIRWLPVSLVAELAGPRQAQQGLLLALADLLRGVLDHAFEQALPVLQRQVLAAQRDQVAAARQALARIDGLDQEIGDARIQGRIADLAIVMDRDHHHRHVLVTGQAAQPAHELDAVHVGHRVVHQHQVGDVLGGPQHGVDRALERLHDDAVVQPAHHLFEDGAAGRLVVDDDDRILERRQHVDLRLVHGLSPSAGTGKTTPRLRAPVRLRLRCLPRGTDRPASARRARRVPAAPRRAARGATARRAWPTCASPTCPALLRAGDLLVLNDTRVIKARLPGARPAAGASRR
jgi:hypothetical protein